MADLDRHGPGNTIGVIPISILSLAAYPAKTPLVAFSCRYYYPAATRKTSYHEVYISDVLGHHRRQLTFDKSENLEVRWAGRDKLAWVHVRGASKLPEGAYHIPVPLGAGWATKGDLVLFDLRTGRKRAVAHGVFDLDQTVECPRGKPAYHVLETSSTAGSSNLNGGYYLFFSGTRARKETDAPKRLSGFFDSGRRFFSGKGGGAILPGLDSKPQPAPDMTLHSNFDNNTEPVSAVYWTDRGHKVKVPDPLERGWYSRDHSKAWALYGQWGGDGAGSDVIFEIDWKEEKCVAIADDVADEDFDPDSQFWAASSDPHGLANLGDLQVWARDLRIGDNATGKQCRIVSGAVHVDSVSVQPE